MSPHFDALKERLLRAGIAPRHVKRYLAELSDHLDDIVRQNGVNIGDARSRLGSDVALAAPMLARPELLSYSARYPWAVFGVAPFAITAGLVICAFLLELGVILLAAHLFKIYHWHIQPFGPAAMRGRHAFDVFNGFIMYGAPLLMATVVCATGIRQRMPAGWIILGLAVICIVGGFNEVGIIWSYLPSRGTRLDYGFGIIAPFLGELLATCLLRVAANAAVAVTFYWLLLRWEANRAPI